MPVVKELTELVEINPLRVDLVKTPASGFPILFMKSVAAKDVDKKGNVDEAPDVSNAEAVLRLLATLIESEAREMGAGYWDEVCDIEMLTQAAYMVKCFRRREAMAGDDSIYKSLQSAVAGRANELGVTDPMTDTASKDTTIPDPTIPANPTSVTPPATEPVGDVEKDLDIRIGEAVAKAMTPLVERNSALEAEMAVLKATPIPGGPAVTSTLVKNAAQDSERAKDLARFERLAKDTNDRELSRYYTDRANELKRA